MSWLKSRVPVQMPFKDPNGNGKKVISKLIQVFAGFKCHLDGFVIHWLIFILSKIHCAHTTCANAKTLRIIFSAVYSNALVLCL